MPVTSRQLLKAGQRLSEDCTPSEWAEKSGVEYNHRTWRPGLLPVIAALIAIAIAAIFSTHADTLTNFSTLSLVGRLLLEKRQMPSLQERMLGEAAAAALSDQSCHEKQTDSATQAAEQLAALEKRVLSEVETKLAAATKELQHTTYESHLWIQRDLEKAIHELKEGMSIPAAGGQADDNDATAVTAAAAPVDWADYQSGAAIIDHPAGVGSSVMERIARLAGAERPTSPPPSVILGSRGEAIVPGNCFSFYGVQGSISIKLALPVHLTSLRIDHIDPLLYASSDCAPRSFSVETRHDGSSWQPRGNFTFDYPAVVTQIFTTALDDSISDGIANVVRINVASNGGNPNWTCLYRVRLYGTPIYNAFTNSSLPKNNPRRRD